jgi:hypothetical protein
MQFFKRTVPVLIAFIAGLWFALQYYVPAAWSGKTLEYASNWDKILLGIAYALGLYSLCHLHWRRIRRRERGFGYSILVYLGLGATLYFGLIGELRRAMEIVTRRPVAHHLFVVEPAREVPKDASRRVVYLEEEERQDLGLDPSVPAYVILYETGPGEKPVAYSFDPNIFPCDPQTLRVRPAEKWLERSGVKLYFPGEASGPPEAGMVRQVRGGAWWALASYQSYEDQWGSWFTWQYNWIYAAAQGTMFSILAFFIASAAYRTFRAKTWEAAFLLVAALLVIFGRTTLAGALHGVFPDIADWVMATPNLAAKRGILLGVSLGSIATALRIIFGIERAYLGGE